LFASEAELSLIGRDAPGGLAFAQTNYLCSYPFWFSREPTDVPERHVRGNVIISDRDPEIQIQLPKSTQYVDADRWVLYDIADSELHAFVEADPKNNVQGLYWVQFEGYLPTKPDLKHQYDSPRHAEIGGLDFYVDTWVRSKDADVDSGSDREHIEALVRAKGFTMPGGMMYVRLVHLLDEQKRKELMIISVKISPIPDLLQISDAREARNTRGGRRSKKIS